MLNSLKALLANLFPDTEPAMVYRHNKRVRETVAGMRTIANSIERAIVKGSYGDSPFMCEAILKTPDLSYDDGMITRQAIMKTIAPHWFLMDKLVQEGQLDMGACDFETRIVCSNWYWGYIRRLRKEADRIELTI
jgi:hypothetical protein